MVNPGRAHGSAPRFCPIPNKNIEVLLVLGLGLDIEEEEVELLVIEAREAC